MIRSLGIDLSVGKIKLCLLTLSDQGEKFSGGWVSLPVPFEYINEREYVFEDGLKKAINVFLEHNNTGVKEIDIVIFCTGGAYYMFKSFNDGLKYVVGILDKLFNNKEVYFIRSDSELIHINKIKKLPFKQASAFTCTNFLGTSILASKIIKDGLAIDMGTISTSIIPIINGVIDPQAKVDPENYVLHRYTTGKHLWYGVMLTPIIYISHTVETNKNRYILSRRCCMTDSICSILDLIDSQTANKHVSDRSSFLPSKEMAYINLAESLGVDVDFIGKKELQSVAKRIYNIFLDKFSNYIQDIIKYSNLPVKSKLKIMVGGLGERVFIKPALKKLGFKDKQIISIPEDGSNLWSATSVYGLALYGLEKISKIKLPIIV